MPQNKEAGKAGNFAGKKERSEGLTGWFLYVGSLRTFRSLHYLELNDISFLKSAIALAYNRGIVNENVWAIVAPNEAIPFRVIEPFYSATQFLALPKLDVPLRRSSFQLSKMHLKQASTRNCAESSRTTLSVNENGHITVLKAPY
jgi:hypothetical protein